MFPRLNAAMTPKTSPLKVIGEPLKARICSRRIQSSSPHSPGLSLRPFRTSCRPVAATLPTRPTPNGIRALGSSNRGTPAPGLERELPPPATRWRQRVWSGYLGLWGQTEQRSPFLTSQIWKQATSELGRSIARRMSFCSRCFTDCSWAISRSKCMAKFGSYRLSLFDSTPIKLTEEDGFSTRDRDESLCVQNSVQLEISNRK